MMSLIRNALISIIGIIVGAVFLHAQTPGAVKNAKPAGSVSGRITVHGKGIAGIAVALRYPNRDSLFGLRPRAVTDQDGNYKINNVAAGSYEVEVGAVAYVMADNASSTRNVVVGDGENIESVNFSLVRGGVITGKITDANGRPAIEQQVRLLRADTPDARTSQSSRPSQPVHTVSTDDRGVYRMFGLVAGRYYVAVGRSEAMFVSINRPGSPNYPEVFYPDASDQTKATSIQVTEGSEATNIDITVGRPVEVFSAKGRAIETEKGQPVPNVRFGLLRKVGEGFQTVPAFITTNAAGDFTAEGLIPGTYSAYSVNMYGESNSELRVENTTFDIIDSDVSGITIRLTKGATISGQVILETDDKGALTQLTKLQVGVFVQNSGAMFMSNITRSKINGDGSFRLSALPSGIANLNVAANTPFGELKGFMISRIERDGVTQTRGIEIKENEQLTGVRIILNYGHATLRGVVTIENGPLPTGTRIFASMMRPGEGRSNLPQVNVDERGRFMADGIPPGPYELWVSVIGSGVTPRAPVKQNVVLQEGEITDVAVTIDLNAGKKP
jgi:protocatechuate 3,4-dioxygenase beta subunit